MLFHYKVIDQATKLTPMSFATLVCPAKQNIERKNSLIEHIV